MQPFQEVRSPARRKYNEIYRYEFVGTSVNLIFCQRDKIWILQHRMTMQVERGCICWFVCNMTCHILRDDSLVDLFALLWEFILLWKHSPAGTKFNVFPPSVLELCTMILAVKLVKLTWWFLRMWCFYIHIYSHMWITAHHSVFFEGCAGSQYCNFMYILLIVFKRPS